MGKVPVSRERLIMVVIIGRVVQKPFLRTVRMETRSHYLLGEALKSLAISLIDAGWNDSKTVRVREGVGIGGIGERLDEILR